MSEDEETAPQEHYTDGTENAAKDDNDYEEYIGYKHPPKRTRWPKGYCPNPRGRPRKRKSRRFLLSQIAFREIEVKEGSRKRNMSVLEAIILIVKSKAITNRNQAVCKLWDKLNNVDMMTDRSPGTQVYFNHEKLTVEEWLEVTHRWQEAQTQSDQSSNIYGAESS